MTWLLVATAAFVATHFVTSTPLRPVLVRAIGERPYQGLYSLVALGALLWMIWAYRHAPAEPLWAGLRALPGLVMPFAFVLLACGYWRNPTMVGADRLLKSEEPARGMIRITRHPIMWAVMLWAAAHIWARGDSKALVFFGGFLVLAGLGTILMDSRKRKTLGNHWDRFAAVTSNVPFVAIAQGGNRIVWREIGWLRPLIGVIAYFGVLAIHPS